MGNKGKGFALFHSITDKKLLEWIGIVIVIVLVVLIGWPVFAKDEAPEETETTTGFDTGREQEELSQILSSIKDAGDVQVFITYETTTEMVPAYDSDTSVTTSDSSQNEAQSESPATGNDGTIVLTERRPKVLGVVVVAQGADDMGVKLMLSQAVQTALGVAASKVEVFEMKP